MENTRQIIWADKLGAISAFLCIIHCLAVPALLTLGVSFIEHPVIAYLFMGIAFVSIFNATKGNSRSKVSIILWTGFIGFVACLILEEHGEIYEYGMYVFSITIIAGHLYNLYFKTNTTL
jgi:hypothetical protein